MRTTTLLIVVKNLFSALPYYKHFDKLFMAGDLAESLSATMNTTRTVQPKVVGPTM
jgi:hypothetical protein